MNEELLNKHLKLVIEANKITNITRITSIAEAKLLHIEDSLYALPYIQEAPDGLYIDMGSGAGYPGIPIAIESKRKTILIESVGKKADILNNMISELGLSETIKVYSGRVEDFSEQHKGECSVVTARALSKIGSLLELSSPLLKIGGYLVCYKGQPDEQEIEHAHQLENKLGFVSLYQDHYTLSDLETNRSLFVYKKVHEAKMKLPRHVGFAQKKPL